MTEITTTIAGLVDTTTEAAREIELSTKQQASAVEQVNMAVANVAQATRESEERPAAILVDGVLPGIDGATVIRRVRLDAALRGVPCILLTAAAGT